MHCHRHGSSDSSSAISGGADNADKSQVTLIGNIIYDCDQAALAKQGNFVTLLNNTSYTRTTRAVRTRTQASSSWPTKHHARRGIYLREPHSRREEPDAQRDNRAGHLHEQPHLPTPRRAVVRPRRTQHQRGPIAQAHPAVPETTTFTTWAQAQIMWDWFSLRTGSPAAAPARTAATWERHSTVEPFHRPTASRRIDLR